MINLIPSTTPDPIDMNILDTIVLHKYKEIDQSRKKIPSLELEESIFFERPCFSLKKALTQGGASGVIAEFKRASPSKGNIHPDPSLDTIAKGYVNAGASGISVLTDSHFFKGTGMDLVKARETVSCPVLRKDFILDEYQIIEAKAMGADVVLLIASILTPFEIDRLASIAQVLGLEVLLEVHNLEELKRSLNRNVDLVGVNNRNLNDFSVDINTSIELAKHIPSEFVKVAESGISTPEDVKKLKEAGFQGFLIGERFMKEAEPEKACAAFIKKCQ